MVSFLLLQVHFTTCLINKSKKFCDLYCVPDGLIDILRTYCKIGFVPDDCKYSNSISYDYDYFAFAKSTKTLLAIRQLLNSTEYVFSEDCFLLIRSIFENHIASRYVRENIDTDDDTKIKVINDFVLAPLGVSFDYYTNEHYRGVLDKDGTKVGQIKNPSSIILGKEKNYYNQLYPFLCQYSHSSYGAMYCYFSRTGFTYRCENFKLLTYLLAIFVFTKIYEGVITVNGEDLDDYKNMKSYYDLSYDSLELQIEVMNYLINTYKNKPHDSKEFVIEKYLGKSNIDNSNLKISKMLAKLKDSLFDSEIGSLDKSKFVKGHFVRKYQEW